MKSIYRNAAAQGLLNAAYERTLAEWPVPYETLSVDTRFGKTHVIAAGPKGAEPLVLLHGFGFSSTMWVDNIPAFSESYRVYAVDFIGDINKSEAAEPMETRGDCAVWFEEVLDGLGLGKTNVLGMSYGGFLALLFALYVPNRIQKLITISPGASLQSQSKTFFFRCLLAGIFPTTHRLNRLMDYMLAQGNSVNPALREQFIVAMQNCIPRVKVFAGILLDDELANIHCPVLLLVGEQEVQYDARAAIRRASELIPDLQAELVENAGHGLTIERPDLVNRYCLEFLRKTESELVLGGLSS